MIKAKLFIIRYNVRKSYYDIINLYIRDEDAAAVATVMVTAKIRLRPAIECAASQR